MGFKKEGRQDARKHPADVMGGIPSINSKGESMETFDLARDLPKIEGGIVYLSIIYLTQYHHRG